jgi:hypothetical protein
MALHRSKGGTILKNQRGYPCAGESLGNEMRD